MKLNSKLVTIFRSLITIGILFYAVYYIYTHQDSFRTLIQVDWNILIITLVFTLVSIYASAAENAVLFQAIGAPIGNIESFGLSNVSAFYNLIIPKGGSITKAIYLKQRYKIPYSKAPAIFLGLLVIFLVIGAGIMLITVIVALLLGRSVPLIIWISALGALASGFLFMIDFPHIYLMKLGKIGKLIASFSDGWKALRNNRCCLIKACIWQVITFISSGVWVTMSFYTLGIKINPLLGISLGVLISFANLMAIIPGNLGIQEAIYGYFAYLSGMLFSQGVVTSTLVRAILLLVTFLLAPISWYFLFYQRGIKMESQSQ